MNRPYLSAVVPLFNERDNLPRLHERLSRALAALARPYEIVLVDDGSTDDTATMLQELSAKDPHVRAVLLARNFGQHGAVCAGFSVAHGKVIVTLDADLQNPPEEIGKLVAAIEEGHDVVGGIRQDRQDPLPRKAISWATARIASKVTGKTIRDSGSMLRAYRREVIEEMLELNHGSIFIPAMTAMLARRFTEIPVAHEARAAGRSKYSLFRFMIIFFDLLTGYSAIPIHLVTLLGLATAGGGFFFGIYLLIRRLITGPDASQGVFTLFAILFLFVGLLFVALGLIGEYICRIYLEVRRAPAFRIREIVSQEK